MRIEHDLLGEHGIPSRAYWGIHTARAVENFPITGIPIGRRPHLVNALAAVKMSAARANTALGVLDSRKAEAIDRACILIRGGALHDQFVVDELQGGAGTSTNMNANEVIANLGLEWMGLAKGTYDVLHPLDHVNLSQSTNDAYPTALRVATITGGRELVAAMGELATALEVKARDFATYLKMGRTQLQEAVPMTLGQEFSAFAIMIREDQSRLLESLQLLHEVNLGATAIGTGINVPAGFAAHACRLLAEETGLDLVTAPNLVEATQDVGAFVHVSGVLKRIAVKLSKICNDLRLLSSGPRAGLGEIRLPPVQAGSSIMPGKVNPVIPEVVNQIAYEVIGNDLTVTFAAEAGQLQLNAFEPVIAMSLHRSIEHLRNGCTILRTRCVDGIEPNVDAMAASVGNSLGLATALSPVIGYAAATEIAAEAARTGRSVTDVVLERGVLAPQELAEHLNLTRLVSASLDGTEV
jgi:aspartate ammonia-lyase